MLWNWLMNFYTFYMLFCWYLIKVFCAFFFNPISNNFTKTQNLKTSKTTTIKKMLENNYFVFFLFLYNLFWLKNCFHRFCFPWNSCYLLVWLGLINYNGGIIIVLSFFIQLFFYQQINFSFNLCTWRVCVQSYREDNVFVCLVFNDNNQTTMQWILTIFSLTIIVKFSLLINKNFLINRRHCTLILIVLN